MEIIWRIIIMIFKIGIYGKTRERALMAFDQYINKIEPDKIQYIKRNRYDMECALTNGMLIKAVVASESCRGQKFDRIIYDDDIDDEILNCIIYPSLVTPVWSFKRTGLDL